jgi:hypothetical protein
VTTSDRTPSTGNSTPRKHGGFRKFLVRLLRPDNTAHDPDPDGTSKANGSPQPEGAEDNFNSATAMRRLCYMGAGGCLLLVLFSIGTDSRVLPSLSVGLLIACAATMIGILIGFIFGVPFSREPDGAQPASVSPGSRYRANTSLEQIADWLTKMIVGVGLVEIKNAPSYLLRVSRVLAKGLGTGLGDQVLVLSTMIYFSLCGFLFGFLWARIYLRRWFTEADAELVAQKVITTLSENEERIQADTKAKTRVYDQLNRRPNDPLVQQQEWIELLKPASTLAKIEIFNAARSTSLNCDDVDYPSKLEAVVSILDALVELDTDKRYHRSHAELSYAYSRQKPPNYEAALAAIDEAIKRRDRLREPGWKYYEFRRAMYRIKERDENEAQTPPEIARSIVDDLNIARSGIDSHDWNNWLKEQQFVQNWMRKNKVQIQ